jgi:hypothetical protein
LGMIPPASYGFVAFAGKLSTIDNVRE